MTPGELKTTILYLIGRGWDIPEIEDAVRALTAASGKDCTDEEIRLRDDLARACDMGQDYSHRWGSVAEGAIQTIANLEHRRDSLLAKLTQERAVSANLRNEISSLNGQTHSESEEMTDLRQDFERALREIETAYEKLSLAEQSSAEWEQRAVQAEQNVETLEAELQERDRDEDRSFNRLGLLDIAIAALRGDAVPADQIAGLLAIARKVAA